MFGAQARPFGLGGGAFGAPIPTSAASAPTTTGFTTAANLMSGGSNPAGGFTIPNSTTTTTAPAGNNNASTGFCGFSTSSTGNVNNYASSSTMGGFMSPRGTGASTTALTTPGFSLANNLSSFASPTAMATPQMQLQQQQQQLPMQASQCNPSLLKWQDFTRQSALASYLHEFDCAYNALHPKCRFRSFVYNTCAAGQATAAVQRERYIAYTHGGGCEVEEYIAAQQLSHDPVHTFPSPIHFVQELQKRTERQREAVGALLRTVDELIDDVKAVVALQRENARVQSQLRQQERMLRMRWHTILSETEVLRRMTESSYGVAQNSDFHKKIRAGRSMRDSNRNSAALAAYPAMRSSSDSATSNAYRDALYPCDAVAMSEETTGMLYQRTEALRRELRAPGWYQRAIHVLQQLVTQELTTRSAESRLSALCDGAGGNAARDTNNSNSDRISTSAAVAVADAGKDVNVALLPHSRSRQSCVNRPLLRPEVDADVMRCWVQLTESTARALDALYVLLQQDTAEMQMIRRRVTS